jgi:hypothetical protein
MGKKAKGDHTPARAAFAFDLFRYTDQEWDRIGACLRDRLGIDADQTERELTPFMRKSLRSCIEFAVGQYSPATKRRRAELIALRKAAKELRDDIVDAFAVEVEIVGQPNSFFRRLLPGVDADMETASSDYFGKLLRNLDRQIEQAEQRGDNARKTARDECWSELLTIWCDLGGKPRGVAAAEFLWVASKPVMHDAVPAHKSVVQWLERRATR